MPERKRPHWQFNYWQLLAFVVWASVTVLAFWLAWTSQVWGLLIFPLLLWLGISAVVLRKVFGLAALWQFGGIPPMPEEWKRYKEGEPLAREIVEVFESDRGKWILHVKTWEEKITKVSWKFASYESRWLDWERG